ncbi:MAG TPA: dynamin family protein [Pseudonocardia sp.]|nr:dynamin family protein [Pseudonocardia sp.]
MPESYERPPPAAAPAASGSGRAGAVPVRLTAAQAELVRSARLLLGRYDAGDHMAAVTARMQAQRPVVAVVGEAQRGKTALVNALVGRRLLPTGADDPAGVPVEVRCAEAGEAAPDGEPRAELTYADGSTREVPVALLHQVGTEIGRDVDRITLEVAGGHLPGAVVVDTPSAGGLDGGHARLALAACRGAALLVFVVDAGQPLSGPELRFLQEASRSVDGVVLALTKTDKFPAYRQVAAETRALLERHAPRFAAAPLVPVSSEQALQAAGMHGELAEALRAHSGLDELVARIAERLADRRGLAVRNLLRALDTALAEVAGPVAERLDAVRGPAAAADAARAERAELARLREEQASWQLYLERDLTQARLTAVRRLQEDADELRARWRARLERERGAVRHATAQRVTAELRADLTALAAAAITGFAGELSAVIETLLKGRGSVEMPGADLPSAAGQEAPSGVRDLLDPSLLLISGSAGTAGYGGAATVGVLAGAALPLGMLAGVAALGLMSLYRQGTAARRRLVEWASAEINRVRVATESSMLQLVNAVKADVVLTHRRAMADRIAELDAVVKEAQNAQRASARERQQQESRLELELAALRDQRREIAAQLAG